MDVEPFKCPKCEFTHVNLNSLRIHWQKRHKLASLELRIALFGRPTCACGCGELTQPSRKLDDGFNRYVLGHIARVHNAWGHNPKALKKSQRVRRKQIAAGEWTPWNKGLSAETSDRVAANNEAIKRSIIDNVAERTARSKRMTENRLNGTVPTLYGADSSQWKGGVSALQPLCRSYVYNAWTRPKMKASDWTCSHCAKPGPGLEVHHDKERFAEILQRAIRVLGEPGDDHDKKSAFAQWVADYHVDNNVSGVVLCEACHQAQH